MKIKIPKFPKIRFGKKKKLRATAARRPLRIAASANYDELAEPNMKLSRALLIVLVLHVVAVSGIIAFNAIKTRQGPAVTSSSTVESSPAIAATAKPYSPRPAIGQKDTVRTELAKTAHPASKPAKSEHPKIDRAKPVESVADTGRVYTVAKGDNPVTIAKKLKVSYDELISLNHIDDPRKLQIGQKLLIPGKAAKVKKD